MKRKYRFFYPLEFLPCHLSFEFCDTPAVVSSESSCPTRSHTFNYYRNEKQNQNRSNKDNEISPKHSEIVPLGKRTVPLLPYKHVQCLPVDTVLRFLPYAVEAVAFYSALKCTEGTACLRLIIQSVLSLLEGVD